jgi:hypothetical protein
MGRRPRILVGMAVGALWALALIWVGAALIDLPVFTLLPALSFAFLGPGLVLLAMIGWLARTRFFDDRLIDGQDFAPGSGPWVDQRVLANTVEQLLLALCLWPPAAILLGEDGPGVAVALGLGFAFARLAFWVGYRRAPALRAFGFAATFYPTIAVVLFAALRWML